MITEDYVSFETAKLLKEKGFDEYGFNGYIKYKYVKEFDTYLQTSEYVDYNFKKYYYPCPTLQMAMKWLREEYKMHCDIGYDDLGWFWNILDIDNAVPVEERPKIIKNCFTSYSTYEEACESAIRYTIENLI